MPHPTSTRSARCGCRRGGIPMTVASRLAAAANSRPHGVHGCGGEIRLGSKRRGGSITWLRPPPCAVFVPPAEVNLLADGVGTTGVGHLQAAFFNLCTNAENLLCVVCFLGFAGDPAKLLLKIVLSIGEPPTRTDLVLCSMSRISNCIIPGS